MANPVIGPVSPSTVIVKVTQQPALKTTVSTTAAIPGPMGPQGPMGDRGMQGVAGTGTGSSGLVKLSRGPLSSGRVVRLDGDDYCVPVSSLTASDAMTSLAITQYAVSAAELPVRLTAYGEHSDDTWNFTPGGAVFLGASGFLTQARDPSWAFVRVVGFAVTAQRVFVSPQLPVFLI